MEYAISTSTRSDLEILSRFSVMEKRVFSKLLLLIYRDPKNVSKNYDRYLKTKIIREDFFNINGETKECVVLNQSSAIDRSFLEKIILGDSLEFSLDLYARENVSDLDSTFNKKRLLKALNSLSGFQDADLNTVIEKSYELEGIEKINERISLLKGSYADVSFIKNGMLVGVKDIYSNFTANTIRNLLFKTHIYGFDEFYFVLNKGVDVEKISNLIKDIIDGIPNTSSKVKSELLNVYLTRKDGEEDFISIRVKRA